MMDSSGLVASNFVMRRLTFYFLRSDSELNSWLDLSSSESTLSQMKEYRINRLLSLATLWNYFKDLKRM